MADSRFPIVPVGGVPVVQPPPEIDATNAGWLRQALEQAASGGQATVVVNLTGTPFCDSAGVQVLVRAYQRAVAEGGELLLVIPVRAAVGRIFELTGADFLIPIFADLSQALDRASAVVPRPLQRRTQRGVRIIRTGRQPPGPGAHPRPA